MTELFKELGKGLLIVGLTVCLVVSSRESGWWRNQGPPPPPKIRSLAPTVAQLERIGELIPTRVHVTDVLWAEGDGYRGSWLITGDALLACDVSRATIVKLDPVARIATIRLPPLRVISARVNHEKTKTWSVETTTWLPWKWGDQGVMRDAAMFHAQQLIESAARSDRHLVPAKAQAELLIRQMYDFVDWKIAVEWE